MVKLKNISQLLIAGGLSNLFYSIAYPIVYTITIQDINSNVMNLASLINCVIAVDNIFYYRNFKKMENTT